MVGIIEVVAVIVIAVGRNDRHLHDNGTDRLLKPTLPLPLAVSRCTGLDKISGEDAETRIRNSVDHSLSAPTRMIDVLAVLNMAVGHIDKAEATLVVILGAELTDIAPMVFVAHAPRVIRTGREVLRQCLVADIGELGGSSQLGGVNHLRARDGVTQRFGRGSLGLDGDNTFDGLKIRGGSISLGQNLHLTVGDTGIGEPAERHACVRVTVDVSNHVVWLFLAP